MSFNGVTRVNDKLSQVADITPYSDTRRSLLFRFACALSFLPFSLVFVNFSFFNIYIFYSFLCLHFYYFAFFFLSVICVFLSLLVFFFFCKVTCISLSHSHSYIFFPCFYFLASFYSMSIFFRLLLSSPLRFSPASFSFSLIFLLIIHILSFPSLLISSRLVSRTFSLLTSFSTLSLLHLISSSPPPCLIVLHLISSLPA